MLKWFGSLFGLFVSQPAFLYFIRGTVIYSRKSKECYGCFSLCRLQFIIPERTLASNGLGIDYTEEGVANHNVSFEIRKGQPGHKRDQPKREGGYFGTHRAQIHSEHAPFDYQASQEAYIIHIHSSYFCFT